MLHSAFQAFRGDTPQTYALLKGWDHDIMTWTAAQRDEFVKWSDKNPQESAMTEEAGFGPYERPRAAAQGEEGFGPGTPKAYQEYEGAGDRVFWGKQNAPSDVSSNWQGRKEVDEILAEYDAGGGSQVASELSFADTIVPEPPADLQANIYGLEEFGAPPVGDDLLDLQMRFSSEDFAPSVGVGSEASVRTKYLPSESERSEMLTYGSSRGETVTSASTYSESQSEAQGTWGEMGSPPLGLGNESDILLDAISIGQGSEALSLQPISPFDADLESLPAIPEMNPNVFSDIPEEKMAEVIEILDENTLGVSANGATMLDFNGIRSQLLGIVRGLALQSLISWIASLGKTGQKVADVIQMTGTAMALLEGNPVGAVLGSAGLLAEKYAQQQANINANNWGEDISDKFFGWVQDAGKWYPAVLRKRIRGEGVIDESNEFSWVYGRPEDFYLSTDAAGKIRGHFVHPKSREFRVSNDEWSDMQDFESMNKYDPFRQWQVMSTENAQKMLVNFGNDKFKWTSFDQDTSDFTPYMKKNADFIAGLDYINSRKDKDYDPTAATLSASKSFRYAFNKQADQNSSTFEKPDIRGGNGHTLPKENDEFGYNTFYDDARRPGKIGLAEWFNTLDEILPRQIDALNRTRMNAASEQDLDWRVYNDNAKALPPATTYEELHDQYLAIDAYDDRSDQQKDYLRNKAATRFELKAIGDMGYGKQLFEDMHDVLSDRTIYSKKHENPNYFKNKYATKLGYLPHRNSVFDQKVYSIYYIGQMSMWGTIKEGDKQYSSIDTAGVPAWVNEGEAGLPDWIEMDNWRRRQEDASIDVYSTYMDHYAELNGVVPSERIAENATKFKAKHPVATPKMPSIDELNEDVSPIPYSNIVKTGKRYMNRYWSKRIRRRNAKVTTLAKIREWHLQHAIPEEQHHWRDAVDDPLLDHPFDVQGREVTLERVIGWIKDPNTSPEFELGEPSLAHFYQTLLANKYSWAPKDFPIDERLLPTGYLKNLEGTFKTMLERLPPSQRQRADRIHNEVHKPETSEYLQQHPNVSTANLARDQAGTFELFNDWSLPYDPRVRQVKFNNMLHTQMDFGPAEEI